MDMYAVERGPEMRFWQWVIMAEVQVHCLTGSPTYPQGHPCSSQLHGSPYRRDNPGTTGVQYCTERCMRAVCGLYAGCMRAVCGLYAGCMRAVCGLFVQEERAPPRTDLIPPSNVRVSLAVVAIAVVAVLSVTVTAALIASFKTGAML